MKFLKQIFRRSKSYPGYHPDNLKNSSNDIMKLYNRIEQNLNIKKKQLEKAKKIEDYVDQLL